MKLNRTKLWLLAGVGILLLVTPPIALALDEPFYLTVIGRIMIFAIAALAKIRAPFRWRQECADIRGPARVASILYFPDWQS